MIVLELFGAIAASLLIIAGMIVIAYVIAEALF